MMFDWLPLASEQIEWKDVQNKQKESSPLWIDWEPRKMKHEYKKHAFLPFLCLYRKQRRTDKPVRP